ncbi:MAG: nucleoside monophosphate kinase [Candidatus Pacearchaeota archaeon]
MKKLVIGIIGTIGSGKGTLAKFLVDNYNFRSIVMGNLVRAEARKRKIKATRETLHNLQAKLRKKNKYYFINKVIDKIEKSKYGRWVVDGLRNPEDALMLKKKFNAKIIFVDAPIILRWKRTIKRGRSYEKNLSFEEFLKKEKEEKKIFRFNITKKYADYKIFNDKSKREFYKKIKKIINLSLRD